MRFLLYTGKGGVGKTSVAAATGLRAAELGYRTVVLSTDSAHSLSDSLETPLGPQPLPVAPNLWAQEVNVAYELESHWRTVQSWVAALMVWRGVADILAEEMAILPGMEEVSSLLYVERYHDSQEYDVVILDCAPTGETLRLLSFPEVGRWWMERIFPIERGAAALLRPVLRPFFDVPVPDDAVFEAIRRLFYQLDKVRTLLTDPQLSSVRLVVNPEKMVVKEAQRTYTYLNLYNYSTDLIVCNRLLPPELRDHYFDAWKESQGRHFQLIQECFAPLPILTAPLMDQEVVGLPMLRRLGQALYGEQDPTKVFYPSRPHRIQVAADAFIMTVPLPFVEKEQIALTQNGDELLVQAGPHKRNLHLPKALLGLPIKDARFEGDILQIRFERPQRRRGQKRAGGAP
ncbi:MAG: ArsA family ATPase [Chloroflexi bacterium]|nr:ArsA family ATPase [Chloroflexota bacterium]